MIQEVTTVNINDQGFRLHIDVNDDPQKKGLQVQFIPQEGVLLNPDEQDNIAIELQKRLDAKLSNYGMQVERDRQLKDKTVIAFFVYIEYFDELIRQALAQDSGNSSGPEETSDEEKSLESEEN